MCARGILAGMLPRVVSVATLIPIETCSHHSSPFSVFPSPSPFYIRIHRISRSIRLQQIIEILGNVNNV